MSINFTSSLIDAMDASYTEDTFVRTLGFFAPDDGGAALYRVNHNRVLSVNSETFYYDNGVFSAGCFELIPQNGRVFVEQFGVMPGDSERCSDNTVLMNLAVNYASSKGLVLAFSPKQTYYFDSSIVVKSNLFIEGNDAVVRVHQKKDDVFACHLFNMSDKNDLQKNVVVSNLTVIGRTNDNQNLGDQAFHVCIDGFTLRNVTIKNFNFGVHTYSRGAGAYEVPEIPSKNWLIEGCSIADTVTGLMLSEIDGLTVKNSKISCRPDHSDLDHCIYMSANCLNVRVANTVLCDVSGDAIHKSFAATHNVDRADISKNHFYTDLSIHNADSALDIGIISQNVMCDNVFATEVEVVLQLSGADNCIVSNSNFSQTRPSDEMQAFIYAENACNCWMQNSYVYYEGRHRATDTHLQSSYIEHMFVDKKHRQMFIGEDFKIPNHWFKFTGCEFVSTTGVIDSYFYEVVNERHYNPIPSQFGEYLDNCYYTVNSSSEIYRFWANNDFYGGITFRNCYMKNTTESFDQPPFRYWCEYRALSDEEICDMNTCPINASAPCALLANNKKYPWLHFENNLYDHFSMYEGVQGWQFFLKGGRHKEKTYNYPTIKQAANISNSYAANCYKLVDNSFETINDLMASI